MRHFRVLSTFAGIAFAIFAVSLVFFLATRPNALEIYLDEASIGTVRLEGAGRDLTLEYITRHAAARLESHLGSNVRFVSEIEANPVRAGTGVVVLTFDNLVTALIDALDYYVFGAVVMVDGDAAATLPSLAAAEDLLGEIAGDLRQGGGAMPFQDVFAQDVDIARGYVRRAELMTRAQAHSALTTPRNVPGTHIVQAGDTFWGIEQATGMSINDIAQANPGVNPANLQVGQIIRVVRTVPILTARDDN
jgi:nucleoid-associated protein YgaU